MALRKLSFNREHRPPADEIQQPTAGTRSSKTAMPHVQLFPGSTEIGTGRLPLDHTTKAALKTGVLTKDEVESLRCSISGPTSTLSWRQCALAYPELSERLHRLAAKVYGFRSLTVCQIGTYIYNVKLTEFFTNAHWSMLFERDIVPVVEYGNYPKLIRRHILATANPGSRHIRDVIHKLPIPQSEIVYVSKDIIEALQHLLVSNIPVLSINPFITQRMGVLNPRPTERNALIKRAA